MTDDLTSLPLWEARAPEHRIPAPPTPALPTLPAAPTQRTVDGAGMDWALVRALRARVATELAGLAPGVDQQEAAAAIVADLLAVRAADLMAAGQPAPSPAQSRAVAAAVSDALFRMGRLQPLLDDPTIENIEIDGHDNVLLQLADGRLIRADPVADSEDELLEMMQFAAAQSSGSPRLFSEAHPTLHMRLEGNARLAASNWITPRISAVIRLHRLVDIGLADLVERNMLDPVMASFLAAAVRAGKSIVVSGAQGAGKTTLLRALAAALDPFTRIGTIETERELFLHETGRHPRCLSWEARPGSGEMLPNGRMAGEIDLDTLVADSFRFNLERLIVGEVRGREVIPMFKAMQSGAGSMSTTHAPDASAAIERLVTCAMEDGGTSEHAYRQVAAHINLIVQVSVRTTGTVADGHRDRFVSEVLAVGPGENDRPSGDQVWAPDPVTGRAIPKFLPSRLADELARHGFDPLTFHAGAR